MNNFDDTSYEVPILLLIFNRPHLTRTVFNALREIKPRYLFVACDGARKHIAEDVKNVQECQQIIAKIDWPCELKTLYREQNLGSGKAIFEAVSWFFQHVDQGIVLEDDCLPNTDFFTFTREMLNRHAGDEHIGMIAGTNYKSNLHNETDDDASYFCSRYCHVWGWATWASRWADHVEKMRLRKEHNNDRERFGDAFKNVGIGQGYIKWFWSRAFRKRAFSKNPGWEYNWVLSCWRNAWLTIIPNVNLVSNLGHGAEGTRTVSENAYAAKMRTLSFPAPYMAPPKLTRSKKYDTFFDRRIIIVEWTLKHEVGKFADKVISLVERALRKPSVSGGF